MAWVTWRQHRPQLVAGLGMLVGLALAAALTAVPIRAAYHRHALASCLPPSERTGCDIIVRHFQTEFVGLVDGARGLLLLPALVGLFVGAPLLARELEHGTYRLAWTQTVTRRRWLLSKTLLIAAVAVLLALLTSGLTMWWRGPFDAFGGRMSPRVFEIEGLVVPAYTVFALAVGILAGLVLRRTVAAMTVTLVVFVATRLAVASFVRPRFLPAVHQTTTGTTVDGHTRDWILSAPVVDAVGNRITAPREDLAILHAQQASIDPHAYLASLGWHRVISFQPADRFWAFQALESLVFVGLAALVVLATVWVLRRSPA